MTTTNTLDRQTLTVCVVASVVGPLLGMYFAVRGLTLAKYGTTSDSVSLMAFAGLLLALGPTCAAKFTRHQGWTGIGIVCLLGPTLLLLL